MSPAPHLLAGIVTAALLTFLSFVFWFGYVLASMHTFLFGEERWEAWEEKPRQRRLFLLAAGAVTVCWVATSTFFWFQAFQPVPSP